MKPSLLLRLGRRVVANHVRRRLGRPAIPYKVLWNTTYYCNSRCQTCNVWQIYPAAGSQKDELHGRKVADTLSSLGSDLLWLTLTGGEPTLKLHVAETVTEVYDRCPNLGFISVNTNALLPKQTAKVMEAIASHCHRAEVLAVLSLDGVGELHDEIRGMPGNFAGVEEARRSLRELSRRLPNLGWCIQSTVSRHNLKQLPQLIDYCAGLGDEHLLTFAQEAELYRNYGAGHDVRTEGDDLAQALRVVARRYHPRRARDLVQWAHLRLLQGYMETRRAPVPCTAGSSTLTLGPKGEVSGCLFIESSMGTATDFGGDLRRVLATERARAVQDSATRCSHCWTNCESFTSMLGSPFTTVVKALARRPRPRVSEATGPVVTAPRPCATRPSATAPGQPIALRGWTARTKRPGASQSHVT